RQGQKVSLETKRQRKGGTLVDVFVSGAPVIVAGQQVAAYVLYRDITDQKRAESLSSALYRIAEKTTSAEDLNQFYGSIHAALSGLDGRAPQSCQQGLRSSGCSELHRECPLW